MHALQIPFTGLVVGGLAVIIITLIANFSENRYSHIFKSLLLVLMIKAMISPYTPFAAYIAVAFQAVMGYVIFHLLRINIFSIFLLSTLAMLESAVQKLLMLTLFFGQSFWKAADELIEFISGQFGLQTTNGSQWIISIYLMIYFIGGICIALMAYKTIKGYSSENNLPVLNEELFIADQDNMPFKKKKRTGLWVIAGALLIISLLLFLFAADTKHGLVAVIRTFSWTCTAMLIWYMVINPLFTNVIRFLLKKKEGTYSREINNTLSILPALRQLAVLAWQKSNSFRGWRRLQYFLSALIHWSLIYTGEHAFKKTG